MNPELQKALLEIVKSTQALGALAWDQAPLVLRDLLVAGAIEHGLWLAFFLTTIGAVWLVTRSWVDNRETYEDELSPRQAGWAVRALLTAGLGALVVANLYNLLVIVFAPRAYLLSLLGGKV